jgi:enolase-phosphatase E1
VSDARETSGIALVLLDIEGTTTPIAFVAEVLFPYARRRLRSHFDENGGSAEYQSIVNALRAEHAVAQSDGEAVPAWDDTSAGASRASVIAYVEWLMDRDRKSTPLKELQGRIWKEGYQRGEIAGEVFPDVPDALHQWNDRGVEVGIFSSGSMLAQQLLFHYSSAGDLTSLIRWHFDTRVGAKGDPESYRRIAQSVGVPAQSVLFLSDIPRELDAATTAGMNVILVVRPGNTPVADAHRYRVIQNLGELTLE